VLVQNDYTYDNTGNRPTNTISDKTGPLRTEEYGYDSLHRLTAVDYDDGQTQGYTFDAMGNRLTKTDNVAGNDTYTYNAANMLLTRNMGSYTNDANGNTLTGGGRTNTWDGQNRLTQCVYNSTTTTHTYGADGLRRRTVQGSDTTDFVLDGDNVIRTKLNSSVDKTFLHGPRGPEYERTGSGNPSWYLYDGLGSVLGTVDGSGTVVHTRKYDVYGAVRASTGGSGPKHKFVGKLGHPSEDETGLIYMRARYCDPVLGRFASEDPAKNGANWFQYANSSPTRYTDADGKISVDEVISIIQTLLDSISDGCMDNPKLYQDMIIAIRNLKDAIASPSGMVAIFTLELEEAYIALGRIAWVADSLERIGKLVSVGARAQQLSAKTWVAYKILMGTFGGGRSGRGGKSTDL
jgi:RHS repeat-associated protein